MESDRSILSQLIQMEILERNSEGNYQLQVPLVQRFIESMIFNHHQTNAIINQLCDRQSSKIDTPLPSKD